MSEVHPNVPPNARSMRAAGVILVGVAMCAALFATCNRSGEGSSLLQDLPYMNDATGLPALAPLQQLHWTNHVFVKVPKSDIGQTPLEQADEAAEREAETAAHWGTLAATKHVFTSEQFKSQLEQMKQNAEIGENKAQRLDHQIRYEGKLLKVGRRGTDSIIAQAAVAARDATFVTDPSDTSAMNAREHAREEQEGTEKWNVPTFQNHEFVRVVPKPFRYAVGTPKQEQEAQLVPTFHNHEFVGVYPKPLRYAAGIPKQEQHAQLKKDEKRFLKKLNHEMAMKKLAKELKLPQVPPKTDQKAPAETSGSDGILSSRNDMTDGVDPAASAAAAIKVAVSRVSAAGKKPDSANLKVQNPEKPKDTSDEGVLDTKQDTDNGVDVSAEAEAANTLANSLVDKMKASAALADKTQEEEKGKQQQDDHDAAVKKSRDEWSQAHPAEDAQVAALKKGLWPSAQDAKVVEVRNELWPEGVAGKAGEVKVLGKGPVTLSERNGTRAAAEGAAGAAGAEGAAGAGALAMTSSTARSGSKGEGSLLVYKGMRNAVKNATQAFYKAMVDMSSAAPTKTKPAKSLATNLAEADTGKQLHAAEHAAEHDGGGHSYFDMIEKQTGADLKQAQAEVAADYPQQAQDEAQAAKEQAYKSELVAEKRAGLEQAAARHDKSEAKKLEEEEAEGLAAKVLREAKEARILKGNKGQSTDEMTAHVMAKKIRTQIQEAKKLEASHRMAARLLAAQTIAVRQNAVFKAAAEVALDYPGATLSSPHQESYL